MGIRPLPTVGTKKITKHIKIMRIHLIALAISLPLLSCTNDGGLTTISSAKLLRQTKPTSVAPINSDKLSRAVDRSSDAVTSVSHAVAAVDQANKRLHKALTEKRSYQELSDRLNNLLRESDKEAADLLARIEQERSIDEEVWTTLVGTLSDEVSGLVEENEELRLSRNNLRKHRDGLLEEASKVNVAVENQSKHSDAAIALVADSESSLLAMTEDRDALRVWKSKNIIYKKVVLYIVGIIILLAASYFFVRLLLPLIIRAVRGGL